ncbi:MAG TPA: phosphatase PAP2 family protein [Rhabdochlamydiaceae bacterium]|nr:phosphatase PAP2 family protein [Rhabdochlamydiaceae bacterium]
MIIKHWKATLLIGIIFLFFSYFYLDQPIALYFQHLKPSTRHLVKLIGNIALPIPHILLWVVIYFFFRFFLKQISMARKAILIAISINLSNVVATLLKNLVGRARPELLFSQNFYGFKMLTFPLSNFYVSFPSSHAATIAALMASLSCCYPRFSPLFFVFAFLISLCRVIIGVHYLSDIIGGMLLGIFAANFVFLSMKKEVRFD